MPARQGLHQLSLELMDMTTTARKTVVLLRNKESGYHLPKIYVVSLYMHKGTDHYSIFIHTWQDHS